MKNEEILYRVKEKVNIIPEIKRWKANWIGNIVHGNCLLKHVIEVTKKRAERRGRRRKQLLIDPVRRCVKFSDFTAMKLQIFVL